MTAATIVIMYGAAVFNNDNAWSFTSDIPDVNVDTTPAISVESADSAPNTDTGIMLSPPHLFYYLYDALQRHSFINNAEK